MANKKIFFSYTLRDGELNKNILQRLKEKLKKSQFDTYIDILDNNDKKHQERVIKELKESDIFCIINTSEIEKSCWVKREIDIATKNNLRIIVLSVEDIEGSSCLEQLISFLIKNFPYLKKHQLDTAMKIKINDSLNYKPCF